MRKVIIWGVISVLLLSFHPIYSETSFAAPTESTLKQKLKAYQSKQKQVNDLQKQINALDEEINDKFKNIAKIQNEQIETEKKLNQLIVRYYTTGQNHLGAQLLASKSVSEFIFRFEMIRLIVQRDSKILTNYRKQAKAAQQEKERLSQKLAELKPLLQKTEQESKQLEKQYQSLETELKKQQSNTKLTKSESTTLVQAKQQVQQVSNTSWLNKARGMIGTVQYRFGASNYPYFDCSSWVQYVFRTYRNIDLPRTSSAQSNVGTPVSKSELQPGDLVFFQGTYKSGISHVGIYLGNGKYISNRNERMDLQIDSINDSYSKRHYWGARRVNS